MRVDPQLEAKTSKNKISPYREEDCRNELEVPKLSASLERIFKDEVRSSLGSSLGLLKSINYKHPFPGPGLGIRIVGNITPGKNKDILQEADHNFYK